MNKQEMKLQKVKKSCKTAKSVTNVLSIILTVAVILCLVGALICFCKRADINTALAASGEQITVENIQLNGVLSLKMDVQELKDAGYFAEVFAIECLFGAVVCLICAVIFRQICKLFMTFENSGSPFGEEVLRTLKRTFIAVTVLVTIFVGLGLGLILGLFLWCIYCIMDYGCALQEEVDETV